MAYGLQIINDFGTVQIDETYRNYGFVQKFSATITHAASTTETLYQTVLSGTGGLLIACKTSVLSAVKLQSYYDGANWTFNWLFQARIADTLPVTETVDFYVFDTLTGPFSTYGFEVRDASGNIVFHSDAKMMKVPSIQGCDTAFSGVSGRTYVPLILRNPIFAVPIFPGPGFRQSAHRLRVSGSTIQTETQLLGLSYPASSAFSNVGAYAAVDVTGL